VPEEFGDMAITVADVVDGVVELLDATEKRD
jgi:hypothetical protein